MNIYILIPLLMFFNSLISIVCLAILNAINYKISDYYRDISSVQLAIISIPVVNLILVFILGLMLFSYLYKRSNRWRIKYHSNLL